MSTNNVSFLVVLFVIPTMLMTTTTIVQVYASNTTTVEDPISQKQDDRLKMAEQALQNGTCMTEENKMMLLTVPDPRAAEIAMTIESCD